jgi:hypothetical protein
MLGWELLRGLMAINVLDTLYLRRSSECRTAQLEYPFAHAAMDKSDLLEGYAGDYQHTGIGCLKLSELRSAASSTSTSIYHIIADVSSE